MFQHHCTACDRTELICASQIRALTNTERGIEVRFECWCGAEQLIISGRRAARTSGHAVGPVAA